jgi:hypothetical protein
LSHAPSPFFALVNFQIGSGVFAWGWPQTVIPDLLLPCSCKDRRESSYLASTCFLRQGFTV